MSPNPSDRLLPRRAIWGRAALSGWFWGVLSALALVGLLVVLSAVFDLLARRGRPSIPVNALAEAHAFFRDASAGPPDFGAEPVGLLATAWAHRHCWCGALLARICWALPPLRDNLGALLLLLSAGLAFALLRIGARMRARLTAERFALATATSLRSQLHRQTLRVAPSDLDGRRQTQAEALFTRNVDAVSNGLSDALTTLWRELPTLLLLLALALAVDVRLMLVLLVPVAAGWWAFDWWRTLGHDRRAAAEARAAGALGQLAEGLFKSRLIRGHGMEAFAQDRFERRLDHFTAEVSAGRRAAYGAQRVGRLAVAGLVTLVLYFVGARVLAGGGLTLADGLLLLAAFAAATPSVAALRGLAACRQSINEQGAPLFDYLAEIPEVGQAVGAKFLEPLSKSIIFESVSYRRDDRELLRKLDLRLPAGQSIALVSVDPAEARTVALMLPRFLEPQQGRILFDSEDIAWGTLQSLRAETAFVGGADACLNGSVIENITCGEGRYSVQDATEAAKLVHAHNFILKLPHGYDTQLGEQGVSLDAGQSFRLGLARAALRKPALLIVEEPEAPLDDDTKALLEDAYNRLLAGRTVIFLPTRLSTIRKCQQVVLLSEGAVAAQGAQADLLKSSELYRHWEYVSFNVFRRRG